MGSSKMYLNCYLYIKKSPQLVLQKLSKKECKTFMEGDGNVSHLDIGISLPMSLSSVQRFW